MKSLPQSATVTTQCGLILTVWCNGIQQDAAIWIRGEVLGKTEAHERIMKSVFLFLFFFFNTFSAPSECENRNCIFEAAQKPSLGLCLCVHKPWICFLQSRNELRIKHFKKLCSPAFRDFQHFHMDMDAHRAFLCIGHKH